MSSITTIISNSDGKASLTQMDSKGFRFEEVKTSIAMIGNKLNEAIEVINILKAENEVLKNKIETKVSLQDIDKSLSKIKNLKNN